MAPPTEELTFDKLTVLLTKALTYVSETKNGDRILGEEILVTDLAGNPFVEGRDFTYDPINKTITTILSSPIVLGSSIRVLYRGREAFYAYYTYTQDLVVCDYTTTQNGIDWTKSIQSFDVVIRKTLAPLETMVRLPYHPADPDNLKDFKIYAATDKTRQIRALSYDKERYQLFTESPEFEDDYVVEYTGLKHLVVPSVVYYVSYFYGARDEALRKSFAPLLGLKQTSRRRYDEMILVGNQSEIVLAYAPLDITNISIYLKGDVETNPATTVLGYTASTNTITVTPMRSYGTYIVAYNTQDALTEDLRKLIIGLINSFLKGPTLESLQQLVVTFTGIVPNIYPLSQESFALKTENIANPLEQSGKLNDTGFLGTNIEFAPSRFNVGLVTSLSNQTVLRAPALTNFQEGQGTVQFLLGPKFSSEPVSHYLLDIGREKEYFKDRLSIYKNERGYLVFELFDSAGDVRRVASPVNSKSVKVFKELSAGATSVQLETRPAFSSTDIDNDGQLDLFGAESSKLIIKRTYGDSSQTVPSISPVCLSIIFQIRNDPEYLTLAGFDRATERLIAVANQAKAAGGLLAIHVSPTYLQAAKKYSNVLQGLVQQGHEVGLYLSAPEFMVDYETRQVYFEAALEAAKILRIELKSFSLDGTVMNWQEHAQALGLEVATGYFDPILGVGLEDSSPKIRRIESTATSTVLDISTGGIGYAPSTADLNFTRPVTRTTLQLFEASLFRALEQNQSGSIATWAPVLEVEDFSNNYLAEAGYIRSWIENSVAPLIRLKKARWSRLLDSFAIFRALEQWFLQQDAQTQNILNRGELIKPLSYDWKTKTLTFEPVPYDGTYEFDYIAGWTAYEESEIFICISYKLRTDDGSLPYYKLYINGELQDFTTFADLPVV